MPDEGQTTVAELLARDLSSHDPLRGVETLVVACSGGGDSTALLHLLVQLGRGGEGDGPRLIVGHVVHGVRPEAGLRDAERVESQAAALGLPFACVPLVVYGGARPSEGELRRGRLRAFGELAARAGADAVALGHTADDVAETVLLNAARGAGPAGLAALRRRRTVDDILLVRPLLGLRRQELRAYLHDAGIEWGEDATNLDLDVPRNRVRHRVLPELEIAVPGAARALTRLASILESEEGWWGRVVEEAVADLERPETHPGGYALDLDGVRALEPAVRARVLRAAVRVVRGNLRGIRRSHVELLQELLEQASGACDLPRVRARLEGGRVRLLPLENRRLTAVPARSGEHIES